ncbi:MAG: hypothetical protein CMH83_02260 [Nocardioides sp.]|nr:hypothetical protein [Nocardioides sp.]
MVRQHALELMPDAEGVALIRRDWQKLRDAGLPSQLDHSGTTNAPHVTVLEAERLGPEVEDEAVRRLAPLLPMALRAAGVVVLGGQRVTIARLLDVPDELTCEVASLRIEHGSSRHEGWLPHFTLARRVPRSEVQRCLDAVGYLDVEIPLVGLRRWDPDTGEATSLHGPGSGSAGRTASAPAGP